jgi:HPr kinase/phosphorylase
MITVKKLFEKYGKELKLSLLEGQKGLDKIIKQPEVFRPGLSLAGHLKHYDPDRMFLFGRSDLEFLNEIPSRTRMSRLSAILTTKTPFVIVTRGFDPPNYLKLLCRRNNIPLLVTPQLASPISNQLTLIFSEEFAPHVTVHGTLVEIFGIGVLLQGESSVGKSETALSLVEKGHRLVADDAVTLKRRNSELIGSSPDTIRHIMEIRGIGIINIALLYGATSVRAQVNVDLAVELRKWDVRQTYINPEEEAFADFLGLQLPKKTLVIKTGSNLSLLVETLAINHRLKILSSNS